MEHADHPSSKPGDPVTVATNSFYYKPMHAVFRALELSAYRRAKCVLNGDVLDLGCGDGIVAKSLRALGVLTGAPAAGLDVRPKAAAAAKRQGLHRLVTLADGAAMPFADASLDAVFANGVLCSIRENLTGVLDEVSRVLKPGGTFAATVPTDRLDRHLLWPSLLDLVSAKQGERARAAFHARAEHAEVHPLEHWRAMIEEHGLEVAQQQPFLGRSAARRWEALAAQPFRAFTLLRSSPSGCTVGTALLKPLVRAAVEADRDTHADAAGYALLVARKRG